MPIVRRYKTITATEKHAWRIENAKRHVAHFRVYNDPRRLAIWESVLQILATRSRKEVERLEAEADANHEAINNVFARKTRYA